MPLGKKILLSSPITNFEHAVELSQYIEKTWIRMAKIGSMVLTPRDLVKESAATEFSIMNFAWEALQELKGHRARILFLERPNGMMTRVYIVFKYPKTSNWMVGHWGATESFPLYGPFKSLEDAATYFCRVYESEAGDIKARLSRETRDTDGQPLIEDSMDVETWLKIVRSWKRFKPEAR